MHRVYSDKETCGILRGGLTEDLVLTSSSESVFKFLPSHIVVKLWKKKQKKTEQNYMEQLWDNLCCTEQFVQDCNYAKVDLSILIASFLVGISHVKAWLECYIWLNYLLTKLNSAVLGFHWVIFGCILLCSVCSSTTSWFLCSVSKRLTLHM